MYNILALVTGMTISVMIAINGGLSTAYGVFTASVVIHIVGCLFGMLVLFIKKEKLTFSINFPKWMFLGGAFGVLTTVFNNFSFGKISLTSIVALGLLGKALSSIAIDCFGLFGANKYPFKKTTLIGLAFAAVGIVVMLDGSAATAVFAVLLSLLTGVTVVLSRTVNAELAERIGSLKGSFVNHAVGLPITIVALFIFGLNEPLFQNFVFNPDPIIYLGGTLGITVVLLFNIVVPKVSSFKVTLLTFVGEVFCGVLLDIVVSQSFEQKTFIGGIIVAIGVGLNILLEKHYKNKESKA